MSKYLGIEFGSTRIKATVIDENFTPISVGEHVWCSSMENGYWTYSTEQIIEGLCDTLHQLQDLHSIDRIGVSGMMHGYLAFDKDWNLLVPFRTWQNTVTGAASEKLTEELQFNIPQRWSIAHLYQAVLNKEEHVKEVAHITTLAGYVHYLLTGENVVGIGEASGIFPVEKRSLSYDSLYLEKVEKLFFEAGFTCHLRDVLPKVLPAGSDAGAVTLDGSEIVQGLLPAGIRFCPPEGDAGTGMVATNAVLPGTGNVSAGTSIFSMIVLDRPLQEVHTEIDIVATPAGDPVAMVHCNNCTSETNKWVDLFYELVREFRTDARKQDLYPMLYRKSMEGASDCGGLLVCNYLSGESVTRMDAGVPMVLRRPDSAFTLSNFFRAQLYSAIATLRIGMEILKREGICIHRLMGHGGLFKTPGIGQKYLAAACGVPVSCMTGAGEGGAYGMAVLAAYADSEDREGELGKYLQNKVFRSASCIRENPDPEIAKGFGIYMEQYEKLLEVERTAVQLL